MGRRKKPETKEEIQAELAYAKDQIWKLKNQEKIYANVENDINAEETTEDESADTESDAEESGAEDTDTETDDTEAEASDTDETDAETEESSGRNIWPIVLLLLVLGGIGGYFAYSRLKDRKKEAGQADPDDEYITDDDDADADDYLDDEYEEDEGGRF